MIKYKITFIGNYVFENWWVFDLTLFKFAVSDDIINGNQRAVYWYLSKSGGGTFVESCATNFLSFRWLSGNFMSHVGMVVCPSGMYSHDV